MKRQMIILQSAQSDSPIDRDVAGASGYADFPEVGDGTAATNEPPNGIAMTSPTSSSSEDSPDKPLLLQAAPYTDMSAEGNVVAPPAEATLGASGERQREEERPTGTVAAAPYLVSNNFRYLYQAVTLAQLPTTGMVAGLDVQVSTVIAI